MGFLIHALFGRAMLTTGGGMRMVIQHDPAQGVYLPLIEYPSSLRRSVIVA
jgi:hypothetical protein